jgi:TonB-dependent receptor
MNLRSTIHLTTLLLLITISQGFSQGLLKGIVSDSLTRKELIGANVFLVGTSLGAATNIDGRYLINSVPAGTFNVKVSYIGYKAKEISIVIKEDVVTELNIQLSMDVLVGEEVVVTGQMMGQISAINQQLSSNTIINVVSEEKIQELPDQNAAETIGRLPGVSVTRSGGEANKIILRGLSDKYVSVTIDGVRVPSTDALGRGIDLSTISQNSLAGIELFKALTADKDADAIAGSVNLVTKKAPSLRQIKTVLKGGYNGLMQSAKQYDFSLKYGERFFDDLFGIQVSGNIENKIRSTEISDIDYDQSLNHSTDYFINNFNLRFTDEIRKRNGLNLILDYELPDEGNIMLNSSYNSTSRDYITFERDYPNGGGETQYLGGVTYRYRDREQELETYSNSLTGNNYLLGIHLNWGLSLAQSTSDFPYDYELDFSEPPDQANQSGMRTIPDHTKIKDHPEQLIPFAYNNFRTATLAGAYYTAQNNLEKNKTAYLNISHDYVFGDFFAGELKLGGKYSSKSRDNNQTQKFSAYYLGGWQPYERLPDGTIRPKDLSGSLFDAFFQRYLANPLYINAPFIDFLDSTPESRLLFDLYDLNPLINRDKLRQWYELNKYGVNQTGQTNEYNNDPTYAAYYYDITEAIASTYITNTLKIGQNVTFISGLRLEKEDNDYKNKYSYTVAGGFPYITLPIRDTSSTYTETVVLPNFHLNIKVTDFMNIRLAGYRALARPDFNMRLNTYFAWRPAAVGGNRQLIVGNPKLKTAKAWNFEVNTTFYGNEIGLLSISAFYKEIKDMYHMLNQINTTGNIVFDEIGLETRSLHGSSSYQLTVPYNSTDPSKVWGFELEHQINFTFLPGLLQYIVLTYNASIVRSETQLIGSTTDTTYTIIGGIPFPEYKERAIKYKQQLENQPKFFGNISLGYDIGGFSGRISLFHQSDYFSSFSPDGRGDVLIAGFDRVDLALKQKVTDYLTILLNINNLTNLKDVNQIDNRASQYIIPNTSQNYGLTGDLGVIIEL